MASKKQFAPPTTEVAAQARLQELSRVILEARPLVEQLARLQAAQDVLRAAEAEAAFVNDNLEALRAADLDRAASEYDIQDICIVPDTIESGLKKYTVHGTLRGVPFAQPLNNQSRVLMTAVTRRPELIPAYVLLRDPENPLNALLKHYQDCARGYVIA
ncbi:hypothetical protein [Paraburkholderia hospita]|uniref:hypothetical protein n=1 Tax=Paraburkholderia hospita TaxID=169430 RepID=UPI003ED1134A